MTENILPFDIETAKLALLVGTGKVVCRSYQDFDVEILNWDLKGFFRIEGTIGSNLGYWTEDGEFFTTAEGGLEHLFELDLVIKVIDEENQS